MVHPAFKAARLTTVKSTGNSRDTPPIPSTARQPSDVSFRETSASSIISHDDDDSERRIPTIGPAAHVYTDSTPTGSTSSAIASCRTDSKLCNATLMDHSDFLFTSPHHARSSSTSSKSALEGRSDGRPSSTFQTGSVRSSSLSTPKTNLPLSSQRLQRSYCTDDKSSRPSLQDKKLNTSDLLGGRLSSKRKRKLMSSPPRAFLPGHKPLATFQKLLKAARASEPPVKRPRTEQTAPTTPNPLGHRDRIKAIDVLVSILMRHRTPPGLMIGYLEEQFLDQLPLVLHGQFLAVLNSEPFFISTILEPNSSRQQVLPIPCIAYDESLDDFYHERLARINKLSNNDHDSRRAFICSLFGDELY